MKNLNKLFSNKYFLGLVFLVLLLMLVDWIIYGRSPVKEIENVSAVIENKVNTNLGVTAQPQVASATVAVSETAQTLAAAKQLQENFNPKTATKEQFQTWFKAEVKNMQNFNVDEDRVKQNYLQLTAQFSEAQYADLKNAALNSANPVQDRILSAYLLSFSGYAELGQLSDFAKSDLNVKGKPEAHSLAETQYTQERAMRILAIDRLADLAKGSNPSQALLAKNQLENLIRDIKDSNLRNYAQSKLNEIK